MEAGYLALERCGALDAAPKRPSSCSPSPAACARATAVSIAQDERGLCLVGRHAVVASAFPHFGEESCLRGRHGSGTVFFSGCSLRCVFCQNFDIAWHAPRRGRARPRLAEIMLELQRRGCHNVNWVTPEHVVPQLLEAMPARRRARSAAPDRLQHERLRRARLPRLLDGVVDVYMPDFKLWTPERAGTT